MSNSISKLHNFIIVMVSDFGFLIMCSACLSLMVNLPTNNREVNAIMLAFNRSMCNFVVLSEIIADINVDNIMFLKIICFNMKRALISRKWLENSLTEFSKDDSSRKVRHQFIF